MTITPDKVIRSGFLDNLGSDLIAVNHAGHVIGRASTREALDRACPNAAAVFTESDFTGTAAQLRAETAAYDEAFAAVVAQVDPAVLADYEMPPDFTVAEAVLTGVSFTRVTAEGIEHVASEDVLAAAEPKPTAPVVDGSAFDLDGDGHVGGSRPKASRQRKPIK
jgi:hypothetical protein